jgi:hypothetical protein
MIELGLRDRDRAIRRAAQPFSRDPPAISTAPSVRRIGRAASIASGRVQVSHLGVLLRRLVAACGPVSIGHRLIGRALKPGTKTYSTPHAHRVRAPRSTS